METRAGKRKAVLNENTLRSALKKIKIALESWGEVDPVEQEFLVKDSSSQISEGKKGMKKVETLIENRNQLLSLSILPFFPHFLIIFFINLSLVGLITDPKL